jgi:hypothetical protein
MQAQGFSLLSEDRTRYSRYKAIVKAADFAVQHSGHDGGQALQALDSMQRQVSMPPQQQHSRQARLAAACAGPARLAAAATAC